jgi:cytidine deaminase
LIKMQEKKSEFTFRVYDSLNELDPKDAALVRAARKATKNAFAKFSNFKVGAAARVKGIDEIYTGSNQENAAYPVGICAERSLLATIASKFGNKAIETMAISYDNTNKGKKSEAPISPCGMCRQALLQYEENTRHPIRILMSGKNGKIVMIDQSNQLLPLHFNSSSL